MSQMLPPELAGMQPQAGAPPADLAALLGQPGGSNDQPPDALASLQDAIHSVVAAMSALGEAQDTHDAAKALTTLTGIQTRLMASGAQAPR